jgi:hypothetical protein
MSLSFQVQGPFFIDTTENRGGGRTIQEQNIKKFLGDAR